MRRGAAALLAVFGALALVGCARQKPLVVAGATLIDGTGAPPVADARVVVVDGQITCTGGPDDCPAPADADVLDSTGFWVIPGLIDTDIGVDAEPGVDERARLRFLLGITTSGQPPTLTAADQIIRSERGQPLPRRVLSALGSGGSVQLQDVSAPYDTLAPALAAEGRALEPRLLERELSGAPYRLPAGLHQLLELPLFMEAVQSQPVERSAEEQAELVAALDRTRRFVREYHLAGGSLVTGSGGRLAPGLAIHEEMRALVTAGLAPEAALHAATRDAAAALGLDDRGTLEPGRLGDMVILEGDPHADIANTQLVSRVVRGGVLYDPVVIFEGLLDEPGTRVSSGRTRLFVGFGASLLAVLVLVLVAAQHRKTIPPNWRA